MIDRWKVDVQFVGAENGMKQGSKEGGQLQTIFSKWIRSCPFQFPWFVGVLK